MSTERSASGPGERPCAVWLELADALLEGIHHTLNNRMAALAGVAQVLETELPPGHPLAGAMTTETRQLESTVALLRVVARGRDGPAPILPADVLDDVRRLSENHHSLRDLRLAVEVAPGVLPLWVEQSCLTHALVVLVATAGQRARQGRRRIEIAVSGDERTVVFAVSAEGARPSEDEEDERLRGVDPAVAGELVRAFGGAVTVREDAEAIRGELRMPTLLVAKRD